MNKIQIILLSLLLVFISGCDLKIGNQFEQNNDIIETEEFTEALDVALMKDMM